LGVIAYTHKTGSASVYSKAPANNSWNNLPAIRLTKGMFNAQRLPVYAVSLLSANLRHTEALGTMPSAINRSALQAESEARSRAAIRLCSGRCKGWTEANAKRGRAT
jgi:hypothetical protein